MKNWNLIGNIKAIILAGFFLLSLISGPLDSRALQITDIIIPLIGLGLMIPLQMKIGKTFMGFEIAKPNWNDNPFIVKKPLRFMQFGAYFFISAGLSELIGTLIRFHHLGGFAFVGISGGIGILIGIRFTLKWVKN